MAMKNEDILSLPPPKADERMRYGSDRNQFFDVYRPANDKQRCAAMIHGGYWRAKYDLAHDGHLCKALADEGWTALNLEYRRVGNEGGGWPGTFSDLRTALQMIFGSAKKWQSDPKRTVILGHSAGGQLALALAGHDPKIQYVVSLAGIVDLHRAYELHLSNDAVVEFLGGTPEKVPEHYNEASPARLKITAQQLIVHGTKDDVAPFLLADEYVRLKKDRERIEFLRLEGSGHFEVIDPRTPEWKKIAAVMAGWVKYPG